ncbi:hypothetical protein CDD80_6289 [Ophiocordyceps camponoti-rufipedis]|uniref:Uncharacterized protein n=1 Tax=Ophiocordyceps camponoti-rufipedis TaxID=2004952 RepID=A0A2C5YKH6_9HYPO|nr:hypothetical protein CDD80_6289 [Ophiocordyceps camponoti-rufipedis]
MSRCYSFTIEPLRARRPSSDISPTQWERREMSNQTPNIHPDVATYQVSTHQLAKVPRSIHVHVDLETQLWRNTTSNHQPPPLLEIPIDACHQDRHANMLWYRA